MADDTATSILGDSSYTKDPAPLEDLSSYANDILTSCENTLSSYRLNNNTDKSDSYNLFLDNLINETLLLAEKKCRLAFDGSSNSLICKYIIVKLFESGDVDKTCKYINILSKKRNQTKRVIIDIVSLCMDWIFNDANAFCKYQLIEVLSNVCSGKMFLESEWSKLIFEHSQMKEREGDIKAAAEIVQDVPIETFGSIPKNIKTKYILEQMRLLLLKADYIRFFSCSRKINEKLLFGDDVKDMRILFYNYMIQYYIHEENYFETSKCYTKILETPDLPNEFILENITNYVIFLIISNHSEERTKLLGSVKKDYNNIIRVPIVVELLDLYLSKNLIVLPFNDNLSEFVKKHPGFLDNPFPRGDDRLKLLQLRAIQHNIQIIQEYYTSITIDRLVQLTRSTREDILPQLFDMVNLGLITAKIDSPQNLVNFACSKTSQTFLNEWSESVDKVLGIVDETCRLIEKDKMMQ